VEIAINAWSPAETSADSSGRSLKSSRKPGRRVPSGRADRPGVHADEVELAPGELVPTAVQGVELEVPVRAGRRGIEATGVRGQGLEGSIDGTQRIV
jgi:hypothetical protein